MSIFSYVLALLSSVLKPSWTVYKDVRYDIPAECTADLYLLDRGVHPVIIWIHGGGWASGDKSAYEGRARKYAAAGFHSIAINYRLGKFDDPSTQWPAQLDDVRSAIRWVRRYAAAWRIDPARIGVGGDSAGAHLALMLGTTSDRPNAILDMFGPSDLSMPGFTNFICSLPIFGGKTCEQAPALYASASPLSKMTSVFPPTMIMHGVNDATVPYVQSYYLDQRMAQLGVPHHFVSFGGGHEFAQMSVVEQESLELQGLQWFNHYLA